MTQVIRDLLDAAPAAPRGLLTSSPFEGGGCGGLSKTI